MSEAKKPKRNWPKYNEALVQRGEILLSLESLKGWPQELLQMNRGKNGCPLQLPPPPHPVLGHSLGRCWGMAPTIEGATSSFWRVRGSRRGFK